MTSPTMISGDRYGYLYEKFIEKRFLRKKMLEGADNYFPYLVIFCIFRNFTYLINMKNK